MKELATLLAAALCLPLFSACRAAASVPDDTAIVERLSVQLQQLPEETPVSIQAERHGNRLDYAVQGEVENTLILAAWYDTKGRLMGVSRGENGTISVEEGADMYRIFLVDADSLQPLCPAWSSGGNSRQTSIPQTGWTSAVPAAYRTAAEHPGTVERLDYDTKDYAGGGIDIRKTAYVYLPYG